MTAETRSNLTTEQQAALSAHDRSVSLAAGAGCGKTFVLTERFLSYLDPTQLEPVAELSELVAITFTDAAAREMRDRIRGRCYQRMLQATDTAVKTAWKRLLSTLDGARISTIHSFCGTLLRSHAAEVGLDPQFEMLDPPAAELLRLQCLDDHLRQLLQTGDERLIRLATHFELRNLRDYVAELLGDASPQFLAKWLNATPGDLVAHWLDYYTNEVGPEMLRVLAQSETVQALRQICETALPATDKLRAHLDELRSLIDSLPDVDSPQQAVTELNAKARVQGVCTKKDWDDIEEFESYKKLCETTRDAIKKSGLQTPPSPDGLHEAAAMGLELLQLVAEVASRYEREKQRRNVLEFDDLLSRAYGLLVDERYPHVRDSLARGTRLLMVDEFQDTDPLQVEIVKALRGDDWSQQGLFVVGDFKQSIYRFRGAEPRVSSQLRATLPAAGRLSLTTNFRSQPAVINFVNALFHDAFPEGYEPLVAHRKQLTPTPAVEFLWASPDDPAANALDDSQLKGAPRARLHEARFIARRLAELIDEGAPIVVDSGSTGAPQTRPLQLGDIVVLLRTLSDVQLYEEAFREYGLDYYLVGGHAFYAQQEIYDVLHLLRSIASSLDELSLAGVLRSPMFALTDETLFWLVEQAGSLNAGLFSDEMPEQLCDTERSKVLRAASTLDRLRQLKDRLLVAELLTEAIADTGYDAILLTEFLGQRKLANVQKLVEQARSLDRTRPGDLQGFVTQLSEFVVRNPKEPLAATSAEGDVIRIMTIHYAKGLEFPLVVVPDLERKLPNRSNRPVFSQQLGPLVPDKEKRSLVGWDLHHFVEQEQEREERKRLLYVACTRAADYLMLSSSVEDLHHPKSPWMKLLGQHFDLTNGSCLTELPSGYAVPEIRVITELPPTVRKPVGPTRGTDLEKMIAKTLQLAEAGRGVLPEQVQAIAPDASARRRFSFSRLSGRLVTRQSSDAEAPDVTNTTPSDSNIEPRELGNLVHAVLERLDFAAPDADVRELCDFLAPQYVREDVGATIDTAKELIDRLLRSPRCRQLATAQSLHREVELILPWSLAVQGEAAGCYIHGFIDCLYQDTAGNWHVLDYKSNLVDAKSVRQAAARYEMQMFVYGLACEQALGVAPTECVLHFLRPGEEVTFTWDNDTQSRLTKQLTAAILAEQGK